LRITASIFARFRTMPASREEPFLVTGAELRDLLQVEAAERGAEVLPPCARW
jgi:hypothetical protein